MRTPSKHLFADFHYFRRGLVRSRKAGRITQISYLLPFGSPSIFKCNQSNVATFGPAKINFDKSPFSCIANQIPEKKLHSAEIMRLSVRATVFVDHFLFVSNAENCGNCTVIFFGDANPSVFPKTHKHLAEPRQRMWWQLLPLPGDHVELVKLCQQGLR